MAAKKKAAKAEPEQKAPEKKKVNFRQEVVPAKTQEMGGGLSLAKFLDVQESLKPFIEIADELEAMSKRAVIKDAETFQNGSNFLSLCAAKSKQLEAYRVAIKKPIDDYGKLVQATFMPLIRKISDASALVSKQMTAWQAQERRRIEAEQAEQRRKQEEEAQKLADQAREAGNEELAKVITEVAASTPASAPARVVAGTNDFGQSFQTRKVWQGSIANEAAGKVVLGAILRGVLPYDLIEFRTAKLNEIAREKRVEGVHEGITIKEVESGGVR